MPDRFLARLEMKFVEPSDSQAAVGSFEGYGAVFGNVDAYGDVIQPGAFKQSLKEWRASKRLPPMLLQHAGWLSGAEDLVPIGVWDQMAEDEVGLAVTGRLIALDTDRGRSVYAAMKERALDGLSIGYLAKEFTVGTKPTEPARLLKRVELVEVSLVTFPANPEARVETVKAARSMTEREFERFLREAGFAREEAKTIVAKGYRALQREAVEPGLWADIVAGLNAGTAILQER